MLGTYKRKGSDFSDKTDGWAVISDVYTDRFDRDIGQGKEITLGVGYFIDVKYLT